MSIHDFIRCLQEAADKFGGDSGCQIYIHTKEGLTVVSEGLPDIDVLGGDVPSMNEVTVDFSGFNASEDP